MSDPELHDEAWRHTDAFPSLGPAPECAPLYNNSQQGRAAKQFLAKCCYFSPFCKQSYHFQGFLLISRVFYNMLIHLLNSGSQCALGLSQK